jgi:hypothetical protein
VTNEFIMFAGVPVGVRLLAETEAERNLLWSMRNLTAKASETFGMEQPVYLVLCPQLPWRNEPRPQEDV